MRPIRSVGRRHSLRRRGGAAAAVAAGALFALAGAARANAPNPLSEHVSTSTAGSGAVTVTLNGTWDWGTLTTEPGEKSSPQLNCAGRYGVGWAVDWQDPSASPWNTSSPSRTLPTGHDPPPVETSRNFAASTGTANTCE